ncbi:MAG: putative formate dehydrogenase oxidoreductase protein [Acidobacteria bacterium]|nr:putative formate dehydrogenase oxidoreductase protein [Acidobacteriota bacterium]
MIDKANNQEIDPREGTQIEGAHEAANAADNHQASHWTAGKENIRSESDIVREAVESPGGADSAKKQIRQANLAEASNFHGEQPLVASYEGTAEIRHETPEEFTNLRVTRPERTAAGLPAIISTMRHTLSRMGIMRTIRTLKSVNQKDGFDCQSCAWADPDGERHFFEFCENGAKAVADEATTSRATPEFFERYSVAELSQKSDFWLNKQGRITHPMILRKGAAHYAPVSWEEAFSLLADELNRLASPDEAVFYTSGRASNESAFLYQLFVRQYGTNNLPDCSNMCHESSGTALTESIGIGKGTVTLEDFDKCDLIIILGQNPGTNHPRMLTSLENAKRNGAKILTINPLPEAGLLGVVNPNPQEYKNPLKFPLVVLGNQSTPLSDLHLPVRINGDMAVLKGMMKYMLAQEAAHPGSVLDTGFIERDTAGFEEFRANLEKANWYDIVEQSGVSRELIERAAALYIKSNRVITCWAMGLTQHKNAVGTIQEIANLHFMRGNIGKEGAGLCPVRGHSNVQGDRTVGIWERPREEFLKALDEEFKFTAPRKHGYDTVESIKAMHVGRAKVFFALGGNFLSASPDTEYTAHALRRCSLTAQIITKLNRTALIAGEQALILPCLGRSEKDFQAGGEQFISCENTMGVVQMSKGILEPASEHLRSEPWIVARLAKAVLGAKSTVDWDALVADYDYIRGKIERTIPGFENYNERVRRGGGFYLPNGPRENVFPTATGKANFTVHELPIHKIAHGELIMMTIRTHDQFNTTIYGLEDRYRGVHNERRVILMNPADMIERNLESGQVVDITSHFDDNVERKARHFIVVPYDIPRRCAATYYPETNVLVPIGSTADRSNTPVSKFIRITVAPHKTKPGEPSIVGKFDYDYVDGYAQKKAEPSLSRRATDGLLGIVNLEHTVGIAVWATIIGAVLKGIYDSQAGG